MDGRLVPKARRVALSVTYSFFVGFLIDFFLLGLQTLLWVPGRAPNGITATTPDLFVDNKIFIFHFSFVF